MPTALEMLSDPAHGLVREARASQRHMATGVQDVLDNGGVYVVEAPTGVGKSLAYLTPAIMTANRRVVIATAKKGLQDQIRDKELPAIAEAVGPAGMKPFLRNDEGAPLLLGRAMKGKANYACQLLAEKHPNDPAFFRWLAASQFGDKAEYPGAPPAWWPYATAEDCIGRGCEYHGNCKYIRLKQDMAQSKVVVVNHHLLGADMFFGLGKLVGGPFDVLVIDEAHKLADGIRAAFTLRAAHSAVTGISKGLENVQAAFPSINRLRGAWNDLFNDLPTLPPRETMRRPPVFSDDTAGEAMAALKAVTDEVGRTLKSYGVEGDPEDPGYGDAVASAMAATADPEMRGMVAQLEQSRRKIDGLRRAVLALQGIVDIDETMDEDAAENYRDRVRSNTVIYEQADRNGMITLFAAPVMLGGIARAYFSGIKSVIITSATLPDDIRDVIGVPPTKQEVLPPAFDYKKQGFLYVPRDLPHLTRTDGDYARVLQMRANRCLELVRLSQGGAFILTTANDEMDVIATTLKKQLSTPVFVQGHGKNPWDGEAQAVLTRFMATPNATLIGSKSFWEGIDVQGERLRLVIISKIPFPLVSDPIVQARKLRHGDASFRYVDLVDMLVDLRQGVGRLIRSVHDRGVVAILDSRIWTKPYGAEIKRALHFPVTDKFADCERYLPQYMEYFRKLNER